MANHYTHFLSVLDVSMPDNAGDWLASVLEGGYLRA